MALPGLLGRSQGRGRTTEAEGRGPQVPPGHGQQGFGVEPLGPIQALGYKVLAQAMAEHQGLAIGDLAAGLAPWPRYLALARANSP